MGKKCWPLHGQLWCLLKLTSAMQTPRAIFGDTIRRKPKLQSLLFPQVPLVWHHTGGVGTNLFAFKLQTNTASCSKEALKHKAIPASWAWRPCSGDGPALSSWWLLSLFPVANSHWRQLNPKKIFPQATSPYKPHPQSSQSWRMSPTRCC